MSFNTGGSGRGHMLSIPMDRGQGSFSSTISSASSTQSGLSEDYASEDNYTISPRRSPTSSMNDENPHKPLDDFSYTPRGMALEQEQSHSFDNIIPDLGLSPNYDAPHGTSNLALPEFNIEQHGDPRIQWYMYYKFVVTKNDAFWKLRPGYIASAKYPAVKPVEKTQRKSGKRCHPCHVMGCHSKPFSRHYDLERHFRTVHANDEDETARESPKESFYCDYSRCPHKEPLVRKDHCREHYREYHKEDLIKRGHDSKNDQSLVDWLKTRNVTPTWWRCNKCLRRISSAEPWRCMDCHLACEPERVGLRKSKMLLNINIIPPYDSDDDATLATSSFVEEYNAGGSADGFHTTCGECKNGLESTEGNGLMPCPTCLPEYGQEFDAPSINFDTEYYV